ncbi:MAG: phosphate ABC transporter permease subunit PstC [Ktedonobacteraceae bacterium]
MQLEQKTDTQQVSSTQRGAYTADRTARIVFAICAILLVVIIVGVFVFVGYNAFRVLTEGANLGSFFSSSHWDPSGNNGNPVFGATGLIIGSVIITLISVIIATPLAFGMALFFTEMCPRWLASILQPLIEVFTGMPSVVIGFLGLVVLVPFLRKTLGAATGGGATSGFGWGAAILVLVIMILPTVISVSIDALRAVPNSVREASLALGSTRWQMMSGAIIPAATTGLATAVVLGMARAIGETLAVSLVLGGSSIPKNLFSLSAFFQPNVAITQQIAINFGEAQGADRDAYFMLAFILLIISFLFICVSRYLASRSVYK